MSLNLSQRFPVQSIEICSKLTLKYVKITLKYVQN